MLLNHQQICQAAANNDIKIEPFSEKQVQPASYDLRVGGKGISTSGGSVRNIEQEGFFQLLPGDFGIILTREVIRFDNRHAARIGLRSKYARKGVLATTGPQVDPGFFGRLKIGVTNLSPHVVSFPFEDDFITLEVHRMVEATSVPYTGPFQGNEDLTAEDISSVVEGENSGFHKVLDSVKNMAVEMGQWTTKISSVDTKLGSLEAKFDNKLEVLESKSKHIQWTVGIGMAFLVVVITVLKFF